MLPYYSVPVRFFTVDSFPTTSNSKLDRNALVQITKQLDDQQCSDDCPSRPLTITEEVISNAFKKILKLSSDDVIGFEDDFLDLGGNSLRQIRLAQHLSAMFGVSIPLRLVIQHSKLKDLGVAVDMSTQESTKEACTFLEGCTDSMKTEALSIQEESIFESVQEATMPSAFNVVVKLQMAGEVDLDRLKDAIECVLSEYEIFRCVYRKGDAGPRRRAILDAPKAIQYPVWGKNIEELNDELMRPIDLSKQHPLKIYLLDETWRSWMMIKMHHIICDKTSIKILLDAVSQRYRGIKNSCSCPSYASWAGWQRSNPFGTQSDDTNFWRDTLTHIPQLPFSVIKGGFVPTKGFPLAFTVPIDRNIKPTLETCIASVYRAVSAITAHEDIVIGIPHMDRSERGTEGMIGLFLDCIPVRIRPPFAKSKSVLELTSEIRRNLNASLMHSMPLASIREQCDAEQLFDVVVAYHAKEDAISSHLKLPNTTVTEVDFRMERARFPLLADFLETDLGLRCSLEYCPDLVQPTRVESIKKAIVDFYA